MIIAGTGHRPDKLGGYNEAADNRCRHLARLALNYHRPAGVISGMALGWDMALAEAAIDLKIPVLAAVPFKGQELRWPNASQERYHGILAKVFATEIVCDGGYAPEKMQRRNEFMVKKAGVVWALWNGTPGGTANCVKYAESIGRKVVNLWADWERL